MFNILSTDKGISMVESLVAVMLTAIAIVALMPMQDNALKTISRSDYLGRAQGIMQSELELQENQIMTSGCPGAGSVATKTVYASGLGTQISGDAAFTVTTNLSAMSADTSCIVNVKVVWSGNTTGIKSSIIATSQ